MMQGDSYGLKVNILNAVDVAVTPSDVSDVEITVGSLRKTYKDGEVTHDGNLWVFPITQEESFKLPVSRIKAQVRVKWSDGTIEGVSLGEIHVKESNSKEVL